MRIEKIAPHPHEKTFFPGIGFKVEIIFRKYSEAILGTTGWLETDDGKIIAEINEGMLEQTRAEEVAAEDSSFDDRFKDEIYKTTLVAVLDRRALEYIEKRRLEDRKRDVNLFLSLNVKSVQNKANVFHSYTIKPENVGLNPISVPASSGSKPAELLVSTYDPKFFTPHLNQWLLSGNNSPIFIAISEQEHREKVIIRSSDWIHDYAPKLELGEYFVVEIPKGDKTIEKAWGYIEKAEECFRIWDTKGVFANCRELGTLLNTTISEKFKDHPIIKKWKRAYEKFNHLASLDLHLEDIKKEMPVGEIKIGKTDTEHVLIVAKALIKYAEESLREGK